MYAAANYQEWSVLKPSQKQYRGSRGGKLNDIAFVLGLNHGVE